MSIDPIITALKADSFGCILLVQQGQQYQRIVDDVRRSLAVEFLENTSLTVEEIAGRVGFSEASNFRKAFRKWTGQAPAHFRP